MRSPYYVWHNDENIYLPDKMTISSFDSLVAMRMVELITDEKSALKNAIKNAIKLHRGNFGCDALCRLQKKKGALDTLKMFTEQLKKGKSK